MFRRILNKRLFCQKASLDISGGAQSGSNLGFKLMTASAALGIGGVAFDAAQDFKYMSKFIVIAYEKLEDFLVWAVTGKPGPWVL